MRVFFLFMIVNGAVVFVSGPQRWLGVGNASKYVGSPLALPFEPARGCIDDYAHTFLSCFERS